MSSLSNHGTPADSVDEDTIEVKPEDGDSVGVDAKLQAMKVTSIKQEPTGSGASSPSLAPTKPQISRSSSSISVKSPHSDASSIEKKEEVVGGDMTVKMEPGQPPKMSRSTSQKVASRSPQLFNHVPDSTDEAKSTFTVMEACTYSNKWLGYTEHAMECDCAEEWGK